MTVMVNDFVNVQKKNSSQSAKNFTKCSKITTNYMLRDILGLNTKLIIKGEFLSITLKNSK